MNSRNKKVFRRINVGRADGTRFNRWYVDADKLNAEKTFGNSVCMDLQEGDVIVIPGVTSFRVVKDNFGDECCDYCSLWQKNPNRSNALPVEKLALLCLLCDCSGSFENEKYVHLKEDKDGERV